MFKKLGKITAVALTIIMLVASFAGCGAEPAASTTPSAPTTSAVAPVAKEPVTLEWLSYATYGKPAPDSKIVKAVEERYNVKFNFWFIDGESWDQVLGVKLASGDMPDTLDIKNTSNIPKYVKSGVLAEITPEILARLPAITTAMDQMGGKEKTVDAYYEGKLYALKKANAEASYPTVTTWRTDWLKNVGINKMPETIAEWEKAMYAFRNDDPDKNGKKDTYGMSNTTISTVFGAYGAIPLKEFRSKGNQVLFKTMVDGKVAFAATQPEMKEALALLAKWYKDGIIDPEFVTGENTGGYWATSQAFENGKVGVTGMAMSYHWNPPLVEGANGGGAYVPFLAVNPGAKFGETFDLGKPPVGPNGKSGTHCWGGYGNSGVGFTTKLTSDPEKLEAVLYMLNDVTTDFDKYIFSKFGIENETFKKDPKTGQFTSMEPYSKSPAESRKAGIGVTIESFPIPNFDKQVNPLSFAFMDKYMSEGYSDVYVPLTDASTKFEADLRVLALDAYLQIMTGAKPIEYFDEFVTTFYAKGGKDIETAINNQTQMK